MTTNVPKWVPVTAAIALASLVLTLVLGFNVDRQRRDEERRDCERAVLFRADSRAMWVYVIGLSGPERTPEEQDRFDAFVAELDKRLPELRCADGDPVPVEPSRSDRR